MLSGGKSLFCLDILQRGLKLRGRWGGGGEGAVAPSPRLYSLCSFLPCNLGVSRIPRRDLERLIYVLDGLKYPYRNIALARESMQE
jgi:hypothetical protein